MFWGDGEEVKRGMHEESFIPPPNQTQFETTTHRKHIRHTPTNLLRNT